MIEIGIYYIGNIPYDSNDITHHGVKGMKWGKHLFEKVYVPVRNYVTGDAARAQMDAARSKLAGPRKQAQIGMQDGNLKYAWALQKYAAAENTYNKYTLPGQLKGIRRSVQKATSMVSRFAGNAVSSIRSIGANALANAKNWVDRVLNRGQGALSGSGGTSSSDTTAATSSAKTKASSAFGAAATKSKTTKGTTASSLSSSKSAAKKLENEIKTIGKFNIANTSGGSTNINDLIWKNNK